MIQTEGLTKHYGTFPALVDLNVSIEQGEIFGYIGPNGAGKTTTIRILTGLLKPTRGRATIKDIDVTRNPARIKSVVGYMPDHFGVYEEMRVWEYLDFFGAAFKIGKRKRSERIDYVLDVTGAMWMKELFVDALSHGMKQRIGLARTLIHDPEVLFLDEPTNGLDPRARIEMRQLLRKLANMGKTILVSSHILPELATVCDTVGIIDHGHLLEMGPVSEIMRRIRQSRVVEIEGLCEPKLVQDAVEEIVPEGERAKLEIVDKIVRFEWSASEQQLSGLLQKLVERKIPIIWYREVPPNLEEAFMKVTQASQSQHTAPAPSN